MEARVVIGERADAVAANNRNDWPGVVLAPGAGGAGGLQVTQVIQGSPAYIIGLRNGDIVTSVNGREINNLPLFFRVLREGTANDLRLTFTRGTGAVAAAGGSHTLAVRSDGTLWAWGDHSHGRTGFGIVSGHISTPSRVDTATNWASVSAGRSHTVGIRSDGTLWTWGYNGNGKLGDGTTATIRPSPGQIQPGMIWVSASAGRDHTVAVRSDGTLWAWGNNGHGRLGDGTGTHRRTPVRIGMATNWVSVAAGEAHTVAIRADGSLWAWGRNSYGQLGDGTRTDRNAPVRVGTATDWASATAGSTHTVAVRTDGTFLSWGNSRRGKLGGGTTTTVTIPTFGGTNDIVFRNAPATIVLQ